MAIEFDTHEYEFNHGHSPRGRGGWGFRFIGIKPLTFEEYNQEGCRIFWTQGTYTEAKKAARIEAKKAGCVWVKVCS